MTPGIALVDPVPLPAPGWLLWGLLLFTFTLHVIAMNFLLGGSIIAVAARVQARRASRPEPALLARIMAQSMPVVFAAAVTLGVAALLFLQALYGRVFFASSVVMAWGWFAVVPLLIAAYYAAYAQKGWLTSSFDVRRLGAPVLGLAAILAIAFVYTTNMSLMLRPAAIASAYAADARGLQWRFGDPAMVPRFLHTLTGAVAVAGALVAGIGALTRRGRPAFGAWAIGYGAAWFAGCTILNVTVGLWWLGTHPTDLLLSVLGRNSGPTAAFVVAAFAAPAAIALFVVASRSTAPGWPLGAAMACLLATLLSMVFLRDHVRDYWLTAAGFQPAAWVAPQWGPIVVFFVLLAAALGLVGWMVTALLGVRTPEPTPEPARELEHV